MMPDYGCFVIAWTAYGIVVPLIDTCSASSPTRSIRRSCSPLTSRAAGRHEHRQPAVGTNSISFSRARTDKGIEYRVDARDDGWRFVLKVEGSSRVTYYLNGKPVPDASSGIRMTGTRNRVLVVQENERITTRLRSRRA